MDESEGILWLMLGITGATATFLIIDNQVQEKEMVTEFIRDDDGRIIEIVERKL